MDRRQFLGALALPSAMGLAATTFTPKSIRETLEAISGYTGTAQEIAKDESFWFKVQNSFMIDRSMINLNNGGCSPAPTIVQEALVRHLNFSNELPVHNMWRILEPRKETVRAKLADMFACDREEIAIVRNASEGLQICQLGIDLKKGDEILCCTQDYGRMINTFKQRERREGVTLKQFKLPIPAEDDAEIVRLYEENIGPKTKLILMSHMINLTGQFLPVKKVVQMARKKGIPVIVDGAHSFAHREFTIKDLDCDYFATSLHKWLLAPMGTGMLYVRKNKIKDLWPMTPASEKQDDDIRKFEEIGTHPAGNILAITEAITFHNGIGAKRKEERLRYLFRRWADRLAKYDNVKIHTSLMPKYSCGLANVEIEGVDSGKIGSYLWAKHRMIVTPIKHDEFEGMRITPNVYTTLDEVDLFADEMELIAKNGLPEA